MQQQSMQYHIDAIRNILLQPPATTKHTRNHLIYLDCYEAIKNNIKQTKLIEMSTKHFFISNIIMFMLTINILTSSFMENNPIKILYIPICLYILWINYSYIHANGSGQKIALIVYLIYTEIPLLCAILNEISTNPQTTNIHQSLIHIPIMIITACISASNIIQLITEEITKSNRINIRIIINRMLIHHENNSTAPETAFINEYIQHIILGDIIVVGHKSPIHETLAKRYEKIPHNRTILEQHLYHLSCQIPLIYITPSNNYIPNNINIIGIHNTTTPIFTDPKKEAEEKNIQFPALRISLPIPSKHFNQANITNATAIFNELHSNTMAFIYQLQHDAYDIAPQIYHNINKDDLITAEKCGIIRTVSTKGNPYRLTPLGTRILQTQHKH